MSGPDGSTEPAGTVAAWTLIIRQLSVCSRELRRQLAAAATGVGVSDTEFLLLASLATGDLAGLSQTELATTVGVSAGQVSSLVESLRRGGWTELETSAGDRRRHAWRLTAAGQQLLEQGWQALLERSVEWDRQLSPDERAELGQLLARLQTAVAPGRRAPSGGQARGIQPDKSQRREAA